MEVDPYGFELDHEERVKTDEFMKDYGGVLTRRLRRWKDFSQKDVVAKSSKLKRFVRKGVPFADRAKVWLDVSGATIRIKSKPKLYKDLLDKTNTLVDQKVLESITLDLHRTFPNNVHFKCDNNNVTGSLNNVLNAYAAINKSVGYCQGLNYIAALMLLVLNRDEEKTFWLLHCLIDDIMPPNYYSDLSGLQADAFVFGQLVKRRSPLIDHIMTSLKYDWLLVINKWFLCLFIDVLPVETVMRIWDSLFYEGHKILFRIGVTIVLQNESRIQACSDFVALNEAFTSMVRQERYRHCHEFMQEAFKLKLKREEIDNLRREYDNQQQPKVGNR